jgi:hypothetical protein
MDERNTAVGTLKPIKEIVVSLFHINQEENVQKSENDFPEKLTRQSTPQLESKLRISCNNEESEERNIKSVKNTCNGSIIAPNKIQNEEVKELTRHEEEVNSIEMSKSDTCSSVKEGHGDLHLAGSKKKKNGSSSPPSKDNKKRSKVQISCIIFKSYSKETKCYLEINCTRDFFII